MTAGPTNSSGDAPTCAVTGSPVSLSSGTTSGSATATVTTVAASTSDLVVPKFNNGKGWLGAGSGALLALLVFFGIPARRRSWRTMLGILVALVVMGVMSSCGGGSSSSGGGGGGGGGGSSNPGTAAGTYTFTVTSSGSATSTPAPGSQTFTVSVN
jgi:trimeric autotransporter adhesin